MNVIIPIIIALIGAQSVQTVSARELHAFLEIGKDFSTWIKDRIEQYGFVENDDFVCSPILGSEGRGGHNRKDYFLSLDMAKELSMVERNEKGKQARHYFLECERRAKVQSPDLTTEEGKLLMINELAIKQLELISQNKLQAVQLAQAAPKVEFVDRYVQPGTGSLGLRQVCKVLEAKQNEFTDFLLQRGLMYRTTPRGPLTPRAEHMHAGRFEAKTGTAEHGETSHAYVHYKFSPKGVTWIAGLWGQHKAKLAQQVEV